MAGKSKRQTRIEPSFKPKGKGKKADPKTRASSAGKSGRRGRTRRQTSRSRAAWRGFASFIRRSAYWCLVLGLWAGIGFAGLVAFYGARMPSATTWAVPERPPNVKIVSVQGETLANRGVTGGEALTLARMSPYIPQAVIAIEDRRFYSHFGVDPMGLTRAMVSNIRAGRTVQGGSTLTQQLAKNLFLSAERTLERKVQEVLLALWLERRFTKDQILEMYLNRVYFGSGAYGVEAASRRYFKKPAREVNLAQAALLAGLLKAPSRLSPARNPDAAEARSQLVLQAMRREGFITDREITTAMTQPPTKARRYWSGAEHYAADLVMDEIEALIDGDVTQDLVVHTTISLPMQKSAETALQTAIDRDGQRFDVSQGALVSVDGAGAIRALVGGYDYAVSQFDRASKAKRQPGSAFKPFVYVAALEMGRTPRSVRNDAPVRIGNWTPSNYDDQYRGPVTLSEAMTKSLNTVAAQLVMEAGPENVVQTAKRLGIESQLKANASIALGTSEVTLLELTAAYAPFMNGGYKATPYLVQQVTTADGTVLYRHRHDNPPRVLRPDVLAMMNGMLFRVVREGTGHRARFGGYRVAGKTGTSQAFRDALFVGYAAGLTTGVWFGNDDGRPTRKVTGGSMPALAWKDFMQQALRRSGDADEPVRVAVPLTRPDERPSTEAPRPRRLPPAGVSGERTGSTNGPAADGAASVRDIILQN